MSLWFASDENSRQRLTGQGVSKKRYCRMMGLIDFVGELDTFQLACLVLATGMLLWDTVEVGRNDAANLVNAVFGARVLQRRTAIIVAGIAVIAGATLSSDVIDTARKGIFDPTKLDALKAALAIYCSVYIVDTILLYGYSAFGMPVSTTACLVFELLGAAVAINFTVVNWNKAGTVLMGIVCSIIITGIAAFMIQRAARGAIRDRAQHLPTLLLHGGWVGGGLTAGLCYFLLLKGMKNVAAVKHIKSEYLDTIGDLPAIIILWGVFAIIIHLALVVYRKRAAKLLFPMLAIFGMVSMAFAFGQNDLANCASPGLATVNLLKERSVEIATKMDIDRRLLFLCGILLFIGMATKNSERVTKMQIAAGSMGDHVKLWAPRWCMDLARWALHFRKEAPALAPRLTLNQAGKTIHYDTLRASVIMAVSASVIATASSLGLPVSTTYVAFAAVIATGMADRIFQRGDAELKVGRSIWVVTSWFLAAVIAAVCAGVVARSIYHLEIAGMAICLLANLALRFYLKKRGDAQAARISEEAYERTHPDAFALEEEGA